MAEGLDRVSTRVKATTAAVVGMQTAVIKAESDAADRVCADINRGFYSLIQSQISQKIANLQSTVDSHVLSLHRHTAQLASIRARMERDYAMITSRYMKLFTTINRNLKRRVTELDKPVMDFAGKEMDMIENRSRMLTATVPVAQNEALTDSQRFVAANIKTRAKQVLGVLKEYVERDNQMKRLSREVMLDRRLEGDSAVNAFPVVMIESVDGPSMSSMEVQVPRAAMSPGLAQAVKNGVGLQTSSVQWVPQTSHSRAVEREFERLLSADNSSDRVKRVIDYLFKASIPQTPKA